ncbi:MAG: hypothetical protein EBR82_34195 [Caulobacteraceae bacterium]|nr:hypothetical protein [bacterium]NBW13084.1 hypothetical protein [Caulobacteraceae bacterium]NDC95226.1 hypothetical protein [bacterium]NDD85263.1 hypothetical protein [bacterium]NDG31307.1 hypothetical protein [bacterium]
MKKKFPDLNKDGKVTQVDVLKGRGVPGFKAGGLYANIQAKRQRIAAGSGETMRKPGSKGAPKASAFVAAAKTATRKKS